MQQTLTTGVYAHDHLLTHKDIQQMLLDTGDEEIVEHAPGDYYWGIGADGSGKNMLGNVLMQVRAELQQSQMKTHTNIIKHSYSLPHSLNTAMHPTRAVGPMEHLVAAW